MAGGFWKRVYEAFVRDPAAVVPGTATVAPATASPGEPEPLFRAQAPISCDCGETFRVSAFGLDEETDLVCPACGAVSRIDADQAEEYRWALEDAIIDLLDALGIEADDDVIDFVRAHNRLPTEEELWRAA